MYMIFEEGGYDLLGHKMKELIEFSEKQFVESIKSEDPSSLSIE
jgi:hypothetical protein